MMPVLIHPASGVGVGLGHLSRCLALAQALRARNASPVFLVDDHPPVPERLSQAGFLFESHPAPFGSQADARAVRELAERHGAAALVLDGYAVDAEYLRTLRTVAPLLLLDDFGRFDLPADLIHNAGATTRADDPRLLLGLRYALLQEPLWRLVPRVRPVVKHVLVTVGSMDPHGLALRIVQILEQLPGDFAIDVVVGPYFPSRSDFAHLAATPPRSIHLHDSPASLFDHIQQTDLAISAAGVSLLELAGGGVPTVAIPTNDNQQNNFIALTAAGAVAALPLPDVLSAPQRLVEAVTAIWPLQRRRVLSAAARAAVDGQGALRTAEALLGRIGALP